MSGSLMTLGVGASGHGGHSVAYAAASGGAVLDANSFKDCAHPSMNENLKAHNALSFQVIRIGECERLCCFFVWLSPLLIDVREVDQWMQSDFDEKLVSIDQKFD